jgi:hypothetical protein
MVDEAFHHGRHGHGDRRRSGPTALRSYTISKGPELSDPLDPDSPETGNTIFVLDEFYESPRRPRRALEAGSIIRPD